MGLIEALLAPTHSFTPQQLVVMGDAYDMVRLKLVPHNPRPAVLEAIASHIIALAQREEWDAASLRDVTLKALAGDAISSPSLTL